MRRLTAILFALALVPSTLAAEGIHWRTDLEAARKEAAQTKRLVLAHFWTTTCGPCIALEKTVFNQPNVAAAIEQKYVPVKINAAESKAIAQALGVDRWPTDVILTPDNKVVRRMVSPSTPMSYVAKMSRVFAEVHGVPGAPYQAAIANAPDGPAHAGLGAGSAAPAPRAGQRTQPAAGGRHAASGPSNLANNTTRPSRINNPYAKLDTNAAQQPPTKPSVTQTASNTPVKNPAAAGSKSEEIQLPPGSPPLGFGGFCTVSMRRHLKWVEGDPKWGAIHRGRTYLFAGQAERDEFLKSNQTADSYSPVLSGLDPVAFVEQGKRLEGKRDFAVQYPAHTGRFYMFSSKENLTKFTRNAEGYYEGVRQAMSRQDGRIVR